jgi:hypothetical protein
MRQPRALARTKPAMCRRFSASALREMMMPFEGCRGTRRGPLAID